LIVVRRNREEFNEQCPLKQAAAIAITSMGISEAATTLVVSSDKLI
jgi:hypothetical protein